MYDPPPPPPKPLYKPPHKPLYNPPPPKPLYNPPPHPPTPQPIFHLSPLKPVYAPPPPPPPPIDEEEYIEPAYPAEPAVYNYAYAVADEYSGTNLNAQENRDEYKTVGSYQVWSKPFC